MSGNWPVLRGTTWIEDLCNHRCVFGDVVRRHRRRLSLTQEELAARAGVNTRTIGNLEAGRVTMPRPATVRLLADAFGLHGADRDRFCSAAMSTADATAGLDNGWAAQQQAEDPDESSRPSADTPRQLPAAPPDLIGRDEELCALRILLAEASEASQPGRPLTLAICGMAGVGKTALALHWAHLVQRGFPDGQLYVNLRGFDPCGSPADTADVLHGFLEVLGVAAERIPLDLDARSALWRTLLSQLKVLVLLDNARDAAQVRPLLPGATGCAVVITSRDRLTGLVSEGCAHVELHPLSPMQSHALLGRRIGAQRLDAQPDAVAQILARCAGLPLALVIVAARVVQSPRLALSAIADGLRHTHGPPEAFGGRDPATDLRTVFSWSYATLSPSAARLFRLFGLHGGPDLAPPAAAAGLGVPTPDAKRALIELADAHLITERTEHRYWTHDLLRAYAAELGSAMDAGPDRQAALLRLLDHYLHSSYAAATTLHPHRDAIDLGDAAPGVPIQTHGEIGQAFDWFTREHHTLLGAVELARDTGFARHAWQLAWTLEVFLSRRGHWHDWVATQHIALTAMEQLDDQAGQARVLRSIGTAYIRTHRHHDAHRALEQAATLFAELRDDVGLAHTHYHLGRLHEVMGHHAQMLEHSRTALELFQRAQHIYGQARALNLIGWQHTLTGAHRQAVSYCKQALDLHIKLDHRSAQAAAWDSLGHAHHRLGEHSKAIACYKTAVVMYHEIGTRYHEAKTLTRLGDTLHASDDTASAQAAWRAAIAILTDLDHPDADQVRRRQSNYQRQTCEDQLTSSPCWSRTMTWTG